ncbi:SO2930 family diheme c-type cytochrome [Reichenbachiella sp. MALMAid0571]|uniref:SO2930 family diheme c-type cytochrome n=1 Tax=Reichenbachiella sp. MALMAid0571 TaxID=3143939 RepID=UPI0032DF0489
MNKSTLYILVITLWQLSCQQPKQNEKIEYEEEVFDQSISYSELGLMNLSEYKFFEGKLSELIPAKNVIPYDLNTPLFSDYALKKRFIYIPKGSKIDYHPTEVLNFPVGTVLIKNFYYNDAQLTNSTGRIMETRLLVKKPEKWVALPYIWNKEQTEAKLEITGGESKIALLGKDPINYQIPNMAQCKSCHEKNGNIEPIGPTARQLNRMNTFDGKSSNQLLKLKELGLINNLPEKEALPKVAVWDNEATGTLDQRARAYLEINCAHCHNTEGPAKNSGLYLTYFESDQHALGIMKSPVAAGHGSGNLKHDIVPGKPKESIMLHRMNSTEASVMMPELGRKMIHTEGVELIREWIKAMKE